MRRVGSWGMAVALVGLGAAAAAAGPLDGGSKSSPPGLLSGLFADKSKTKAKAAADKAALVEEKPAAASTVETLASEQQKQMNAILRRMEVCDRLRMVALQTSNEELMRQADELEARAREIYRRQTAHLPIPAQSLAAPAQTPDKTPARRESARGNVGRNMDFEDLPTPPRQPMSGLKPLGGDFESRERDILNGTSMGRDRP